jgi:hypothetical protein
LQIPNEEVLDSIFNLDEKNINNENNQSNFDKSSLHLINENLGEFFLEKA